MPFMASGVSTRPVGSVYVCGNWSASMCAKKKNLLRLMGPPTETPNLFKPMTAGSGAAGLRYDQLRQIAAGERQLVKLAAHQGRGHRSAGCLQDLRAALHFYCLRERPDFQLRVHRRGDTRVDLDVLYRGRLKPGM